MSEQDGDGGFVVGSIERGRGKGDGHGRVR